MMGGLRISEITEGDMLSSRCGVLSREISPSRISMWPCLTGRTRFLFVGAATGGVSGLVGGWSGATGFDGFVVVEVDVG